MSAARSHRDIVVEFSRVSKTFGAAKALDDVNLCINAGTVHGLLGQNGSGKSTLIKILSGLHVPDEGALLAIGDEDMEFPLTPGYFRSRGIAFVHQDLGLVPEMTVTENLAVETVVAGSRRFVSWRREEQRARRVFNSFGVDLDPAALVADLSPTDRALLAIVRAVRQIRHSVDDGLVERALLVLDEPTVFLPRDGVDLLFGLVRSLVSSGEVGVLLVTHDLDEVLEFTDVVTVFRDGRVVGSHETSELSRGSLADLIVGRAHDDSGVDRSSEHLLDSAPARLTVNGLFGGRVRGVDLAVRRGEILGLTGIAGSGYADAPSVVYGVTPGVGDIILDGEVHEIGTTRPRDSLARGIVYVPADRLKDGSVGDMSVADNLLQPVLSRFSGWQGLDRRGMRRHAVDLVSRYDVKPANPAQSYGTLSGGNQQKALLAKWIQLEPQVLLLQEPTQGVDVGARSTIFSIIREAATAGTSVVCASSDLDQLSILCDRVLVFEDGLVKGELCGSSLTKEGLAHMILSSDAA